MDIMEHALPTTILQSQPRLELALRDLVTISEYCTLQSSCEVVAHEPDEEGVIVHYSDRDGKPCQIHALYLIGADGKRGIVRKHFLEKSAGVRQEAGIFEYEGTWIAANLKITLPTRESHPDFPLWAYGYTEEAVYDLFWPANWHFCRPPGKPVACGRFGPRSERLWRHEFAVPEWKYDNDDDSAEASTVFWEHLTPMITRPVPSPEGAATATFPRDCIQVLRCRPFRFSHKVVNRWFSGRIALIGDAAHVFPPFGGQGVACGVADAEGLAWRLAVLTRLEKAELTSAPLRAKTLQSWAEERRSGVDMSARLTLQNGEWCNKEPGWLGALQIALLRLLLFLSRGAILPPSPIKAAASGYHGCLRGAFLANSGGGGRLGQIYVQTRFPQSNLTVIELSDQALRRVPTVFSLLVIQSDHDDEQNAELEQLLQRSTIHSAILSSKSRVHFDLRDNPSGGYRNNLWPISFPAPLHLLTGYNVRPGYDVDQFKRRLNDHRAKYFILRPDSIIYAAAKNLQDLERCLKALEQGFS
ncbi:predicted protein [Aspergillus terreus NIH2624]|uniref:FAD-binding domain-containing protein n=1 Tax=Aspergillus terreus (strain NIH 2624 / FGSC A1156) TaxID=341663 RepID=Q0CYH7_ASPTN|nr:uncharacterized protein ATEG_01257 [Aspergillus terreus NIH2624]EAU38014.1 predicted protein [Aspergillus terreus NIH2624]